MTAWYNTGPYGVAHYSAGRLYDCTGAITIAVQFAGSSSNPVDVVGNLPIVVSLAANLNTVFNLTGALPVTMGLGGAPNALYAFGGSLPIQPAFNQPEAQVGPPWALDSACPVVPWTPVTPPPSSWVPVEPCNG
jgi:hypothetical protein